MQTMKVSQPGLVSVMMPAYNAEAYIDRAIESILGQSYPNWELIIVNDGSNDRTVEKVSKFTDSRIKIFHQKNSGEAAARNVALEHACGEFIAFLDADDLFLPDHLLAAVNYLQAHKGRDGVYSDGYYIDQNGNQLKTLSSRRRGPFTGRVYEEVVRGSNVFGPPVCVVLRSNPIHQFNLIFDQNIIIGPDWDFFTQYADVAQFGYLDHITCLYRVHMDNISHRIGLQKRALELAKCRINAIKMNSFNSCSVETRYAVFYDLLVNLLRGNPEKQTDITYWMEFQSLPEKVQAKLLRLMASKTHVYNMQSDQGQYIKAWLRRSLKITPADWKVILLNVVYFISPRFFGLLLRARTYRQVDPMSIPPFADIYQA
ncbi:MAG: glycosyltransferase family A protein [Anaerolineales bacterium]|jgi:glycosyltransferase involved in cell wall biosynthesis